MRETTIETIASKKAMGQDKETSVATNPQGARIKSSAQITMKQKKLCYNWCQFQELGPY